MAGTGRRPAPRGDARRGVPARPAARTARLPRSGKPVARPADRVADRPASKVGASKVGGGKVAGKVGARGTGRGGPATRGGLSVRHWATLGAITVMLAVLVLPTLRSYLAQRSEIADLQAGVARQEQDVAALRAEQQRWLDPAYVEQQARQRLKFVKPGEKSYTIIDADPEVGRDDQLVTVPAASRHQPWYGQIWESAKAADAGAASAGKVAP